MKSDASPLQNPFALLNLSADATASQIKSASQEYVFRMRLGHADDSNDSLLRIERAAEILKDPVARVVWGMYWVTLSESELRDWKHDPVLSNLGSCWHSEAVSRYELIKDCDDLSLYTKNMAVLTLGTAQDVSSAPISSQSVTQVESCWKLAFQYWALLVSQGEFWDSIRTHCGSSGDPRLGESFINETRSSIAVNILGSCQRAASSALMQGEVLLAKKYVDVIRGSAFAEHAIDQVLQKVYSPLCSQIQIELADLTREMEELDRQKHAGKGFAKIYDRFRKKTYPRLKLILTLGDLPGLDEERARDDAARFLRSLSLSLFNFADDAELPKRVLDLASVVVDSEVMSDRLQEDKDSIAFNHVANHAISLANAEKFVEAIQYVAGEIRKDSRNPELISLRDDLKSAYAGYCFKRATDLIERGEWSECERWLAKALEHEQNPEHIRIITMALAKVRTVKKQSESSCFVATATFDTPHHETVIRLRSYRDDVLASHALGRAFIQIYWSIGPWLAWGVRRIPSTRRFLSPLLTWLANRIDESRGEVS